MTALLQVAAAAAVLAVGFLPGGECVKGRASEATSVLSSAPVEPPPRTLQDAIYREVPCDVLQLEGPFPPTESVKLTGSGWEDGLLEFTISHHGGNQVDQEGDAAVGSPLYRVTVGPEGKDWSVILTAYLPSGEVYGTRHLIPPIVSRESGFMFLCHPDPEGKELICKISGYDNAQEGPDGRWKEDDVRLEFPSGMSDLRFNLQADGLQSRKIYASQGLVFSTEGVSLGCVAKDDKGDLIQPPQEEVSITPVVQGEEDSGDSLPTRGDTFAPHADEEG